MTGRLQVSPLNYVVNLESPIGMYLRREVFRKEIQADKNLKKEIYEKIVAGQSVDGSWDQLFVYTANNLWNLALLGCDGKDRAVKKGLEWLLSIQKHQYKGYPGFFLSGHRKDASVMRSIFMGSLGLDVRFFTRLLMLFICFMFLALVIIGELRFL